MTNVLSSLQTGEKNILSFVNPVLHLFIDVTVINVFCDCLFYYDCK